MPTLRSNLLRHLHQLAVLIGPRPAGSPGNHQAGAYIAGVFRAAGLEVELQEYACPAWEHRSTRLKLNGEPQEARANPFSPSVMVETETAAAGSLAELEAADLEGRVAVLYGDLTASPLSPKAWFLITERETRMIELLEARRPAAILTVSPQPLPLITLIEDADLAIPSASVPAEVGRKLLLEPGQWVRLAIETSTQPGSSANVVARQPGARPEKLVICAHYDTKFDTPGATDNAAGSAVLLAMAEQLAGQKLPLTLEWVAFSSEEYLPMGDSEYMRRCNEELAPVQAVINFDAPGQLLGANSITQIGGSQPMDELLHKITAPFPGVVWVEPWPESNHSSFTFRGVPGIAFTTRGGAPLAHTRGDTVEWVSPAKLEEAASLGVEIILRLCEQPAGWTRPTG